MATYDDTETPLVPAQAKAISPADVGSPDVDSTKQTSGLADQWRSWMKDPHNRAAIMQFGISLSQPIGAGQNLLGHVGTAFGEAGEASDRVTAQEMAERKLSSEEEAKSAKALLDTERASHAGDLALTRQQMMELRRQGIDLADQKKIQDAYINELKRIDARNKQIAAENFVAKKGEEKPLLPLPSQEEFVARYRGMGASGAVTPNTTAPVKVNTVSDLDNYPSGTRYVTPDGRTGTKP